MGDAIDEPRYIKRYGEWDIRLKTERNDYSRMKRKVFMQLVIMLVMSGIAVLLLYNFLQGKIGVWGIGLLSLLPGIDYEQAYKIYEMILENIGLNLCLLLWQSYF